MQGDTLGQLNSLTNPVGRRSLRLRRVCPQHPTQAQVPAVPCDRDPPVHTDPLVNCSATPWLGLSSHHNFLLGTGLPQSPKQKQQWPECKTKQHREHSRPNGGPPKTPRPEPALLNRRTSTPVSPLAHEGPSNKPLTNKAPAGRPLTPHRGRPQTRTGETSKTIPAAPRARKSSIKPTSPGSSPPNLGEVART